MSETGKIEADLLITNAVVVSMDSERRILARGAVVDDRIVAVGRSDDVEKLYCGQRMIDVGGGVVQSGFVDCHVHLSQHLGRGTIPDFWPEEREHD